MKSPNPPKDTCARTWQIDRSVSEDVNRLADELECYPSDLVNMLLQRGLDALAAGQWAIERKPIKYSLQWGIDPSNRNQRGIKGGRTGA